MNTTNIDNLHGPTECKLFIWLLSFGDQQISSIWCFIYVINCFDVLTVSEEGYNEILDQEQK